MKIAMPAIYSYHTVPNPCNMEEQDSC